MNEPKCPYCGVEMVHTEPRIHTNRNGIGVRWQCRYFCPSCHSYAPMMDLDCHSESTIIQAARNAALCAQQERENPMTNADRIRAISDEELAENRCIEIKGLYPWPIFVAFDVPEKRFLSRESAVAEELNWLQQPTEEG